MLLLVITKCTFLFIVTFCFVSHIFFGVSDFYPPLDDLIPSRVFLEDHFGGIEAYLCGWNFNILAVFNFQLLEKKLT